MSYCRFSNADVYVFLACEGHLECCGCWLGDQWSFDSTGAMIAHLREHIAAGHKVPASVIPDLEADRAENDAFCSRSGAIQTHDGSEAL